MKKIIIYNFLVLIAASAFAQKDPQAKVILNQVSQKYRSFNVIKSDFIFTIDDPQSGTKETKNGTLISQSKTNKFKLTWNTTGSTKGDIEQEIINDGKTQWSYIKQDKEVQVNNADHSGEAFGPAQLFTMYEHGYKYIYTGEQKTGGNIYQVVDLTPEDDKKQFFKIRLMIDKAKKQIYNVLVFDKSGSKYNYTLRTFITNAQVSDNTFTYDAKSHPGVEVVDLR